jgi:hypothetical protein
MHTLVLARLSGRKWLKKRVDAGVSISIPSSIVEESESNLFAAINRGLKII